MKKKGFTQLVYKSKHGDIPVNVRDYVPEGRLWIQNPDGLSELDINTGRLKKFKGVPEPN